MGKQPPAAQSITGWWRDGVYDNLADGDAVDQIFDVSGFQGDFIQATGANQPLFFTAMRHGKPAYSFGTGGATHFMVGPDFDDLIANGQGTIWVAIYIDNFDTTQTIICDVGDQVRLSIMDTGEIRAVGDDGSLRVVEIGANPADLYQLTVPAWHLVGWRHFGGDLYVHLDDPLFWRKTACGSLVSRGLARIGANGAGADPLVSAMIGEIIIADDGWSDANNSLVFAYLANRWLDRGDPLEQMRRVASYRGVGYEKRRQDYDMDLPISWLPKAELFETLSITHGRIPRAAGLGAGYQPWERAVARTQRRVEDPDNYKISVTLKDYDDVSHLYRESGIAVRSDDPRREGVMISGLGSYRLSGGGTTKVYVESVADGSVVEVPAGVEATEAGGIVTEIATNQYLLRTSVISGLTGLTESGSPPAGASSVVSADPPQLFRVSDAIPTPQAILFTAGTPHSADYYRQWPLTTADELLQADQRICISIDRRGAESAYWFQNSFDSTWWDNAAEGWDASPVANVVPATADPDAHERYRSNVIRLPAGGTSQGLLRYGLASGGVDGRQVYFYHAQIEGNAFPTSRMPQDDTFLGARGARGPAFIEAGVFDVRFINEPRGTFGFWMVSPWSAEDLEAGQYTVPGGYNIPLWLLEYENPPTNNYFVGRFNASLGAGLSRWEFGVKATGSEIAAFHDDPALLPARFADRFVCFRWTSNDHGELGLAANTLSIFVGDGVTPATKGTDAVFTRTAVIDNARLVFNLFGARARRVFSSARVWPDAEIAAKSIT